MKSKHKKDSNQANSNKKKKVGLNWTMKPKPSSKSKSKTKTNKAINHFLLSSVKFKAKKIETEAKEQNKSSCYFEFIGLINSMFDHLDIFQRGAIGQANISSWIPESALYFLGDIFQKIRRKLTMNRRQFVKQSEKLFFQSQNQDLAQFIHNMKDFFRNRNQINKRKINKIVFEHSKTQQSKCNRKSQHIKINQSTDQQETRVKKFLQQKQRYFNNSKQKHFKLRLQSFSPLNFEEIKCKQNKQNYQDCKTVEKFKQFSKNKIHKALDSIKVCTQQQIKNQSHQFFDQNLPSFPSISKKAYQQGQTQQKLDILSQKLDNYIAWNATRLQRSKNIIQEMRK